MENRKAFGTRKIKKALTKHNLQISRSRIGRIMQKLGLVSCYSKAKYKLVHTGSNEEAIDNILDRQFSHQEYRNVVVSDLTYVRVGVSWPYICVLLDLYNREIIGYSCGAHKTAELVKTAFAKVVNLHKINIFHTDRGNEFKNQAVDSVLKTFHIQRSLSNKGTPYDNAVAEAGFKIIKTEFVRQEKFHTLKELEEKFADYVH